MTSQVALNTLQAHWGIARSATTREILVQVVNMDGNGVNIPLSPVDALAFSEALAAEAKQLLRRSE